LRLGVVAQTVIHFSPHALHLEKSTGFLIQLLCVLVVENDW